MKAGIDGSRPSLKPQPSPSTGEPHRPNNSIPLPRRPTLVVAQVRAAAEFDRWRAELECPEVGSRSDEVIIEPRQPDAAIHGRILLLDDRIRDQPILTIDPHHHPVLPAGTDRGRSRIVLVPVRI